jgi:sigma-B regulation protein RsbU (phosphoserine phosphatase)
MWIAAPELTASEVLRTFHQDAPYLFLGGAFVAVGVVAAGFAALRRKHDPLLIYFALFAALYGLRLWIQSALLAMTIHGSVFYTRLRSAIDYLILIPAVLFFAALGTPSRTSRIANYAIAMVGAALAVATFVVGDLGWFHLVNNVVVIAAVLLFIFMFQDSRALGPSRKTEATVLRWGLLTFIVVAIWVNLAGLLSIRTPRLEPFGFAVLLACLGYVAARRTLERDQKLNEIQKELDVARRIQLSILPREFPESAHFSVAARYVPMTSVAGDFYDYIVADQSQAGLLIADVSGHGVPAALIASMVKLAAASQREHAGEPSKFLSGMNSALLGNTQNQFVTAAYVHLNAEARELRYSAAGHPPMLLLRNGGVTEIEENGLVLAAFDFAAYSNVTHRIEPGDRLLLYTDGVVEASNASGDFLGAETLRDLLKKTAGLSSAAAVDSIVSSVKQWSAKQDDDLTVLVCDYVAA